ncbi:hypothetical protein [Mycobacterium hubeiense]|uniref:hypothetical protein n=1 Tax=Mycobacterium hubeiense TaxID=1867256 RepID=UPI0013040456|nr:hypothetical protein [Mycobacterium sp. QGD 101]
MISETLHLTPDVAGVVAWARKVRAESPLGSNDAAGAQQVLADCGIDVEQR